MAVGLVVSLVFASLLFPLFTLVFCAFLFIQNLNKKYHHIPGPKRGSFIWGNWKEFHPEKNKKARFLVFQDLVEKYGSVFVTWDVFKPIVTVSDPELLISILQPSDFKDVVCRGDFQNLFEQRFLGKGCVFDSCTAFDKNTMERHLKDFNSCCDGFLEELKNMSNGKEELKMEEQFSKLAVDLIAKVAFGVDLKCVQDPDTPFYKALKASQEASWWSLCNPLHKWDITSFEYQNNVTEAVKYLRDFGKKVIDSRRSAIEEGGQFDEDYLTCMLRASANDTSITFDDMLDEFVTVFFTGHDLLTSLLTNFLLKLFQHPMIEEKLYEEVINVVQGSKAVSFKDQDKLSYMSCVLKETLRLNPLVPAVYAQTNKEVKLGDHSIPNETTVQIIPYIMQTNPNTWKNPKEFHPERFLESKETSIAAELPYCMRNHNFVNDRFTECVVKALYPCLLQKFKFFLVPGQDVRPQEELTVIPRDGVLCTLTLI